MIRDRPPPSTPPEHPVAVSDFQVKGTNARAPFTLTLHRGEGMCLLAMNWKRGRPPRDFVGFGIEAKPPGSTRFYALRNRLTFGGAVEGETDATSLSTLVAPIQKFRWIHFPRDANVDGAFAYRVTPIFMDDQGRLSQGEPQLAEVALRRETYPGQVNVAFTRGFVSSQAFVDRYAPSGDLSTLLPAVAADGLRFRPTHPKAAEAYAWMGFEAREAILDTLDAAIAEKATVRVIAYDLNLPEIVERLEKLGARLRIIIDDSDDHGDAASAETQAAARLRTSAGAANVGRQHVKGLQHNKMIVVDGKTTKRVVYGSTNLSWRGLYVQNNNVFVADGAKVVAGAAQAFDRYFSELASFATSPSAALATIGVARLDARVAFSPHAPTNALLDTIATDIAAAKGSVFYSLAFLANTPGPILDALASAAKRPEIFMYGIADKRVGGLDLHLPNGNSAPVFAAALTTDVPPPFKAEPTGGMGTRMHHKFVVIDFDRPTARVYLGSYNFSSAADLKNGENLVVVRDRRIATAYMVEALRIFDHYHFRVAQASAKKGTRRPLRLQRPPASASEAAWFDEDYTDVRKQRDRELFA